MKLTIDELTKEILKMETERIERIYLKRVNDKLTYEEIGKQENITRKRVRQICNRIERKIEYARWKQEVGCTIYRENGTVKILEKLVVAIDLSNGNRIQGLKGKCPFCDEDVYYNWYGPVGVERPNNNYCHTCGNHLEWGIVE